MRALPARHGRRLVISSRALAAFAVTAMLATLLGACGSSGSEGSDGAGGASGGSTVSTGGFQSPTTESLSGGKRGGTLVVLNESDFEHLDPGIAYYSIDYEVVFATQRPLYSHKPNTNTEMTPDMASGPPEISADNKTITVHLKQGIHFSPPVNREVTSQDVAYAIERGANPNVVNPYFQSYFKTIEGAPEANGGPIKGIQTPSEHTIVFHLTEPKAPARGGCAGAAAVGRRAEGICRKIRPQQAVRLRQLRGRHRALHAEERRGRQSPRNRLHPREVGDARAQPQLEPEDRLPSRLPERNPSIKIGGTNTVIGRQVLEGTNVVENEPPAQSSVKLAAERFKSQLEISPGAGSHYIAVNNKVGPFSNIDVRKALWAALDRAAMDKARGGALVTTVATHFIYPTIPGFEQAGGLAGPKVDYNEHPEGDMALAEKYLKQAGLPERQVHGRQDARDRRREGQPDRTGRGNRQPDAQKPGLHHQAHARRTGDDVLEVLRRSQGRDRRVPERRLGRRLRRPADGAQHHVQREVHQRHRKQQLGPGERPRDQLRDDVRRIGSRHLGARATAWAKIDDELVEDAAAIPFDWDKQGNIEGSEVDGVGDLWDVGRVGLQLHVAEVGLGAHR